ncbi:YsnF/AvaK domain-containing protein [Paenibacillus tarimensis]|uniref:YsnF/AvaK domain-containing protein n=1 Tax=Paenibacillus tarimensis TaxID=416012 RepID=UPI001F3D76A4|nr:YsnF/AvaK domain-containing protein [Paenibacillus tarimensis]MCF2944721.1 YsnF/AvaK domain-containing protein [Paenibacillus tarimensis]
MGFFDFFKADEQQEKRNFKQVGVVDTEFAEETAAESAAVEGEATMQLREEEMDISKERVKTGEVVMHKDVVEEEKHVEVPVAHDEVVIERRAVSGTPSTEPIGESETVHIPVTAEHVNVGKHTEVREEISAHKREVQETEHVDDVLHKEVAHVETDGDALLSDTDADSLR